MKKILVVLDHADNSDHVQDYALELAEFHGSHLSAIAVLDLPWLTAVQPEPLGGAAFKLKHDERMILETRKRIQELIQTFSDRAKNTKVPHTIINAEGFPSVEIEKASLSHDLLVMGRELDLHFQVGDVNDLIIKTIARHNPRPIISLVDAASAQGDVLIAYDDSLQASRALHMFLLLGLGNGRKAHILVIDPSKKAAALMADHAKVMCALYGLPAEIHLRQDGKPEDVILEESARLKVSMIIMGAYGKPFFEQMIFGSCTKAVIKQTKIPVFIHH